MKTFKKLTIISVLMFGITTSVFASWWNPFTWSIFKKKETQKEQQVVTKAVSVVSSTDDTQKSNEVKVVENIKPNVFNYPGIEVGQKYGAMTVGKIEAVTDSMTPKRNEPISNQNISVTFSGKVVMRGSIYIRDEDDVMGSEYSFIYNSDSDFLREIPIIYSENKKTSNIKNGRFSFFENKKIFDFIKENNFKTGDEVEIIIDKYNLSSHPSGAAGSSVNVVSIKKLTETGISEVKNWKTYKNTKMGYEISYPADAKLNINDLSCVQINTKEFGFVYVNVGSSDPCGVPTGIADGRHMKDGPLIIEDKEYVFSGYKQNDNSFSFFSNELNKKISIVYGVEHFDKSNPKSWKGLGSLDASEYQSAINSAKEIVSTFKNIGDLNEKGNIGWNKYVNVNRKFAMLYPDDLIAREIYSKDLIVCFESKEKPFKLCVSDTVSELAANDSEVFRDLKLSELESKLNTKISANNSKYDGKYFIYLNNIVIYSEDKDLLQKMLQTLVLLGENEGIHK